MENYLEKAINKNDYNHLPAEWRLAGLCDFSKQKTIYDYQQKALENVTKVLKLYYSERRTDNLYYGKSILYYNCFQEKMSTDSFAILKKEKKKIEFFQKYYPTSNNKIEAYHFFNRACFWMATGSGKSLVIIKTIELLAYLQKQELIDKREIMLLLPRADLIAQFQQEVQDFNENREQTIELVSLKNYEEDKSQPSLLNNIKVYYYRSDLLRDERKENILNFESYDNNGEWYLFLDEAHRGEKQNSKMQNYVSALSRNGFLFNFSATFTDAIDFATTCYNFNLEKFITKGYGKNIYLSQSYFDFNKNTDELSQKEKQKQVLKSLLTFTCIRKNKIPAGYSYHTPLLMTLVHTVSTTDSDLLLFFEKLEEIASGKFPQNLFDEVQRELQQEWQKNQEFIFGEETLTDNHEIQHLQISDLLEQVFHGKQTGRIEMIEGEKGKEIALKLETADKPFALIKVGDIKKFEKEKLGNHYLITKNYDKKKFFKNINQSSDIVLLVGSRSFYEGWDSNRPNVLNLINIGKADAKKFVLQAIGRGIRIEPKKNERKRIQKAKLLETLFIYASDKNSVRAIIETMNEQKSTESESSFEIALSKNTSCSFDLLIPYYQEQQEKNPKIQKFFISQASQKNFERYFSCLDKNTFCLKTKASARIYDLLQENQKNNKLFKTEEKNHYFNFQPLLDRMTKHFYLKSQYAKVTQLQNEIIHFQHIKLNNFSLSEKKVLQKEIELVKKERINGKEELMKQFSDGKISLEDYSEKLEEIFESKDAKDSGVFIKNKGQKYYIEKIIQHYYLPLIYTKKKSNYIQHIIKEPSEVEFIEALEKYESEKKWMFSKIDESLDKVSIPYFNQRENTYHKYYPDFIFWIPNGKKYKIVFVDPKGTTQSAYQNKIDEFIAFFYKNNQPKVFSYKDFQVTFDLKMVNDKKEQVGERYRDFWINFNELNKIFDEKN